VSDGAVRAFLFADLRDYTAFVEREGDRAAAELISSYRTLIRDHLAKHEGAELKTEGDSFYIVFPSPSRAVAFGAEVFRSAHADGAPRIRFGVGIHVGETVPLDGQFVGSAVNVAARVGAMAADGELLVTDTVRGLIRTSGDFSYDDRGTVTLKGVSEPMHLYAVEWRPQQEAPRADVPAVADAPVGLFVGRDAELAALDAATLALIDGRGAIVLVGGAAGLGFRFLPSDLSNPPVSSVGIGRSGWTGTVVSVRGSTTVGVTTTINSVVEWLTVFDLKSAPSMGMLAAPGFLLMMSVVR